MQNARLLRLAATMVREAVAEEVAAAALAAVEVVVEVEAVEGAGAGVAVVVVVATACALWPPATVRAVCPTGASPSRS
jgi:hypothetical protein